MWRSPYLTLPAPRTVCVLCELGHVRKKRLRLADEKPHVGEECESTHGGASVFVGRMIETMGRLRSEERTWLGHDQGLVEELVVDLQITEMSPTLR